MSRSNGQMCADISDSDVRRLQRIMGPGVDRRVEIPRDLQFESACRMTAGCPCDPCPHKATCRYECRDFRFWVGTFQRKRRSKRTTR